MQKELDSMFLSIPEDEIFQAELSNIEQSLVATMVRHVERKAISLQIFQAGLSNIENIINLFKYANERIDMKMRCLRFIKRLPSTQQ
jgi:hypothetical protein